jgi:YD repeat-containing protein
LWTADSADASGNITQFTLGNGVVTTQTYDANTQRIDTIRAVNGSLVIQDQDYGFDALGNLTSREDRKFGVTQSFCYDGLNRLKAARFIGCSSAVNDFTYDALGNLTTKEGIAGYTHFFSNASYNLSSGGIKRRSGVTVHTMCLFYTILIKVLFNSFLRRLLTKRG